jgi:hypothetical protein
MGNQTRRATEVLVKIIQRTSEDVEEEGIEPELKCSYDALIYTDSKLIGLQAQFNWPEGQPEKISNLSLVAIETVVVDWGHYKEYLRFFITGEQKAYHKLKREKLFTFVSPGLHKIFSGEATDKRPLRVWWSPDTPSLVELPWELLAYDDKTNLDEQVSFVRGLPPERPVPILPVGEKLRLAFIHEPSSTSKALSDALKKLQNIEVVDMTDPPLKALQQAISGDFELVHLVADGSVTMAYEGFLYLRKPQTVDISSDIGNALGRRALRLLLSGFRFVEPLLLKKSSAMLGLDRLSLWLSNKLYTKLDIETLSVSELSALQRGSYLAVLGLSPPNSSDHDINRIDGMLLPSIYRAFACIGNSPLPMPNIVAQIGAADEERMPLFWQSFYSDLSAGLQVEKAMRTAMKESSLFAMALFLRQQDSQTFRHDETPKGVKVTQINAELRESEKTLQQLEALKEQYSGLSAILQKYEQGESSRQEQLKTKLQEWLPDEGERVSNE